MTITADGDGLHAPTRNDGRGVVRGEEAEFPDYEATRVFSGRHDGGAIEVALGLAGAAALLVVAM